MKRNFNKEFKEEFKKSFDNGLNKDALKENLNLVPQEDTIIFKKKPFYGFSSLFAALLIIVTASITLLVAYYVDDNINDIDNHNETSEAVDYFRDKYEGYEIKLISKISTTNNISISFVRIAKNNSYKIALFFHKINIECYECYSYKITINDIDFDGRIINGVPYVEHDFENTNNNILKFSILESNNLIFEFCTYF